MNDLKFAFRQMLKNPGFTAVAVLTLALGIGATSLIFSAINTVLLSPVSYVKPDRLVWLFVSNPRLGYQRLPPNWASGTVADLLEQTRSFEQIAKVRQKEFVLRSGDRSEQVRGMRVSANFFDLLGVRPAVGRAFLPEENEWGKHRVVVLSHEAWQRRFGGDPGIVGGSIDLIDTELSDRDGQPHDSLEPQRYTIVGVLPPRWKFPVGAPVSGDAIRIAPGAEVWQPESLNAAERQRRAVLDNVLARLKEGVTFAQAEADTQSLFRRLRQSVEASDPGYSVELLPLTRQVEGASRPALLVLAGATGLVLFIACVNVANLLLGRGTVRRKEFAIRAALGAGRGRVGRQLITESALLALCGAFAGMALAWGGTRALARLHPANLPRVDEIQLDLRVVGFTLALALFAGIVFGLAPAWWAAKVDVNNALKDTGHGSTPGSGRLQLRAFLVVSEVALSLMLLASAGLLMRSFARLINVDPGFQPEHVVARHLSFLHPKYRDQDVALRIGELLDHLRAIPGVQSVALNSWLPIDGGRSRFAMAFQIEGRPAPDSTLPGGITVANMSFVTPDYFRTLGIPLLKGRDFTAADITPGAPPVKIVTESFVRKFLAGEEAIGRRVAGGEIVGVVGDTHEAGLDLRAEPHLYHAGIHTGPLGLRQATIAVRAAGDLQKLGAAVEREVLAWDKDQPALRARLVKEILSESVAERRFQMLLMAVFAGLALTLTAVGVFGVMAHMMAQRTREIGIRMALGARACDVTRLILGQGMFLLLAGLGLGLAGALASTRLLSRLLFDLEPTDTATFTSALVLLTGVGLLACYLPARKATKVDPMVALRHE